MCIRDRVYIEGQISTRKWKDEQSGQDKYSTEIIIQGYNSSLTMLGGANNLQSQSSQNSSPIEDTSQIPSELDDDIPF